MKNSLIKRILTARVYDVALETPLERARALSTRLGNEVFFKREDLQPVFSFKLRGAFNRMFQLTAEEFAALRSQIATSNESGTPTAPGRGGRRYAPQVFTEHGALMAATVLNSPRAVEVSVYVVRAFV